MRRRVNLAPVRGGSQLYCADARSDMFLRRVNMSAAQAALCSRACNFARLLALIGAARPPAMPQARRMSLLISKLRIAFEPVLRRVFHLWFRLNRGLTMGVRGVVIDEAGRVFLVRHSYVSGWHLPGGGVEVGETIYDALMRELREEGAIEISGAADIHGVYFNRHVSRRDHVVVFVVRHFSQTHQPAPNHEILECGFFAPDALPEDATKGTRARIDEILNNAPRSTEWLSL